MANKVVTLFGGAGFIGRHLVRRLTRQGFIVRVATRHPDRAQFLRPLGDVGQVVPLAASVTHAASVRAAVAGASHVVNLVGILYEKGAASFEAVHHAGARAVAEAATAAGVERLVQVSAIGADTTSSSAYARSKAEGEAAARAAFPSVTILRPSIVFGPEDDFFNRFAVMARLSPVLPLVGGGHSKFQPVYVGDVAEAIERGLTDPATQGKTYELGGPRVYSFRELMELLLKEIHRHRPLVTLPTGIARLQARFLEFLPKPPLTRDQLRLLESDNVVGAGALTLADLGITAQAVEAILPTYLDRYRPGGRFGSDS